MTTYAEFKVFSYIYYVKIFIIVDTNCLQSNDYITNINITEALSTGKYYCYFLPIVVILNDKVSLNSNVF